MSESGIRQYDNNMAASLTELADGWPNCFLPAQQEEEPPFCFLRVRAEATGQKSLGPPDLYLPETHLYQKRI